MFALQANSIMATQVVVQLYTGGFPRLGYSGCVKDTEYVAEVSRAGSMMTLKIYNSTGATLLFTESMSCITDTMKYVYGYASYCSNDPANDGWTGTIKNLYVSLDKIPVYVYDTRAGGSSEMYVWPETVYEEQKGDYNQPTESFQFDVALTSGGFMVERLVAEVASSRRV
jgi:hypothetical protein